VYADQDQKLAVMSIGFLLKSKNDAVVWRGPKKHGIFTQYCSYDKDYLYLPFSAYSVI
jgi:hypothetical protein